MMRTVRALLPCILLVGLWTGARAQVVANFTASPPSGCAPLVVSFSNTSTGGGLSYSWDFGNGNTSNLTNPSATYLTAGTYTVSLTASGAGGSNTKTATITVNNAPTVSIAAAPAAGCVPLTVGFTSTASANMTPGTLTYLWNFGNGQNSTASAPTYTYTVPGTYNVALSVTNAAGCVTTVQQQGLVTVNALPVASFTGTTTVCGAPGTASFTNTSTGTQPLTYYWDFGDGTTSTATSPTHVYSTLGSYNVTLVVQDAAGCIDTVIYPNYVTVAAVPAASFTAPDSVCVGTTVPFVSTGTPGTNSWNFGTGSGTATGVSVSHTYNAPGTFTIRNILTAAGCSDTAYETLVVMPAPVPAFNSSPAIVCPPPNSQVTFTNNSAGAVSYTWLFGDGSQSTVAAPTHTYGSTGYFNVTLTANSAFGCSASTNATVAVPPLSASITAQPSFTGCVPLPVNFSLSLGSQGPPPLNAPMPYPSPAASAIWNFGDGSAPATGLMPSHTYTDTGVFTVTATVTTANGCTVVATMQIQVGQPPVASFTAAPLNVCVRDEVTFTSTSTGANNWTWLALGNAPISNPIGSGNILIYTFVQSDTLDITLIAGHYGCYDTLTIPDYVIVRGPVASGIIDYSCDTPLFVQFQSTTSQPFDSVRWYFGDGTSSPLPNPSHFYPAFGNYTATIVAYSASTGCVDTMEYAVNLFNVSPDFSSPDTAVCTGDLAVLNGSYTAQPANGPGPALWSWRLLSTGSFLDTTAPYWEITQLTRGYYTVRLTITDARGCSDSITKQNYLLFSRPEAVFSALPTGGCVPTTVQFTDASTTLPGTSIVSRNWDFGGGATLGGNVINPSHTYTAFGQYDVSLSVTDNVGCADDSLRVSYIGIEDPQAAITGPSIACIGVPVNFLNASLGFNLSSAWDFGNGQTATTTNGTATFSSPGNHTVRLIVTGPAGCSDTTFKTVNVQSAPNASFTVSDSFAICSPHVVQFTNTTSGNHQWQWSLGGGATSTLQNPGHVYAVPGQYTVRLIATTTPGGCRDTAYGTVTVLGFPGALSYGPLGPGCAPFTVNFSHTVQNVPTFVFDFADGNTFGTTGNTATHTYTMPGAYVPRLIMSDNQGCQSSSLGLDTIKVDGTIGGFTYAPFPACDSGTFTLTDTSRALFSTVVSRTWIFGGGITSTAANPVQTYTAPGTYPVSLVNVTSSGCVDTFHSSITVSPSPTVSAGVDTVVCVGDAATLTPSGALTYTWSPATGLSCTTCTSPQASPTVPTAYIVTGRDAVGCTDKDTVLVGLKTQAAGAVTSGDSICRKDTTRLHASGGTSYLWIPAAGLSSATVASPIASPDTTTTYAVIIREGSCIPDTQYVRVVVFALPGVDAGPDQTIVAGTTAQLQATAQISPVYYTWSPASSLSCVTCPDPIASPKNTTTYTVVATTDKGCTDSSDVQIKVICEQNQLFVPNTFTPNGDGENDRFYPRGRGIDIINRFRIYDRWGGLIFERRDVAANDVSSAWDGTVNGVPVPPDVFVFIIEGKCDTGEEFRWQGDIALIK